jgi:hypothetical protein
LTPNILWAEQGPGMFSRGKAEGLEKENRTPVRRSLWSSLCHGSGELHADPCLPPDETSHVPQPISGWAHRHLLLHSCWAPHPPGGIFVRPFWPQGDHGPGPDGVRRRRVNLRVCRPDAAQTLLPAALWPSRAGGGSGRHLPAGHGPHRRHFPKQ